MHFPTETCLSCRKTHCPAVLSLGNEKYARTFGTQFLNTPRTSQIPPFETQGKTNFRGRARTFRPPPLRMEDPHPPGLSPDPKGWSLCSFFLPDSCGFRGHMAKYRRNLQEVVQGSRIKNASVPWGLVAHDCGYPLSRYTCRATRVAADFLDFTAFCRCSTGVALHPLKILVSHLSPPWCREVSHRNLGLKRCRATRGCSSYSCGCRATLCN